MRRADGGRQLRLERRDLRSLHHPPRTHHARRCLELLEAAEDVDDWDVPFAHEALARAHFVAGDGEAAQHHLARAREVGAHIADAADREHLDAALADLTAPY